VFYKNQRVYGIYCSTYSQQFCQPSTRL